MEMKFINHLGLIYKSGDLFIIYTFNCKLSGVITGIKTDDL